MTQFCQQCHAEIHTEMESQIDPQSSATPKPLACPACGGQLIPRPDRNLDPPGTTPRQADHRGILLPRRHAVGGIITPR